MKTGQQAQNSSYLVLRYEVGANSNIAVQIGLAILPEVDHIGLPWEVYHAQQRRAILAVCRLEHLYCQDDQRRLTRFCSYIDASARASNSSMEQG